VCSLSLSSQHNSLSAIVHNKPQHNPNTPQTQTQHKPNTQPQHTGYLQRCLVKNLEALRVGYDGTVRDACDGSGGSWWRCMCM